MTTYTHDNMNTCGHVDTSEHRSDHLARPLAKKPQPVTAPEEWRINLGRRTITHIKSGLLLKMRKGLRGELMAFPVNLERMPRWGTRWPRALREAEALYHAAAATHRERPHEQRGEVV